MPVPFAPLCSELQADKVDITHVLRAANHPSPFTYIIVDKAGAPGLIGMGGCHSLGCLVASLATPVS